MTKGSKRDVTVVDQGGEAAGPVGAEADAVARFRPVIGDGEALPPARHQGDRPAEALRRQRDQRRVLRQREFRAEMAADQARHHAHLRGIEAELRREPVLHGADVAGRLVHGEPVAVPGGPGGEQLDRVVVLDRGLVARLDPDGRIPKTRPGVAPFDVLVMGFQVGEAQCLGARRVEAAGGRLGRIGDLHRTGRRLGGLLALGHHQGHDLAGIGDRVGIQRPVRAVGVAAGHQVLHRGHRAGQIPVGEDGEQTRHGLRGVEVEPGDPAPGDGAGHQGGVGGVRLRADEVGTVAGPARDLVGSLDPGVGAAEMAVGVLRARIHAALRVRGRRAACREGSAARAVRLPRGWGDRMQRPR
jgi:hypothetical protein